MESVRAQVTEKDGEVSCSIDETNRIRALLGLRPLETGPSTIFVQNVPLAEADTDEIRRRIDKARRDRETSQLEKSKSLGEALKPQQLSAADWVALSRKQELVGKAKAELSARQAAGGVAQGSAGAKRPRPTDYSAGDMAGLRIRHERDSFLEGSGVVLTLADRGLLNAGEGGRLSLGGDDEDELVNVELEEKERAEKAVERKKNLKKPMYSGLDDEEFGGAALVPAKRAILSQYDEDIDGNLISEKGKKGKLVIGTDGGVVDSSNAEDIRAAHSASNRHAIELSAGSPHHIVATGTMQRPIKKRMLRKAGSELEDAESVAPALVDGVAVKDTDRLVSELLRQKATVRVAANGAEEVDRGSRSRRNAAGAGGRDAAEEATIAAERASAYAVAQARAREKGGSAQGQGGADDGRAGHFTHAGAPGASLGKPFTLQPTKTTMERGQRVYSRLRTDLLGAGDDNDDSELQTMLARSRRMAQEQVHAAVAVRALPPPSSSFHSGPYPHPAPAHVLYKEDGPAAHVAALLMSHHRGTAQAGMSATGEDAEAHTQESRTGEEGGSMTFNTLTEFSRLLEARMSDQAQVDTAGPVGRGKEDASAVEGQAGTGAVASDEEDMDLGDEERGRLWVEEGDEEGEEEEGGSVGSREDGEGRGLGGMFGLGISPGGRGMAGALGLFAATGAITSKAEYAGRSNDVRPDWAGGASGTGGGGGGAGARDVTLEYKDEFGRKLTPKEAYRQLSYKFHGRAPSKNVRDKRLKRMAREQSVAQGSGTAASVAGMQRVQEVTGSAFIALGKK